MKKAIFGFCIACATLSVNASYLYWQVLNGDFIEESYDSATLWVSVDGADFLAVNNVSAIYDGKSHALDGNQEQVAVSTGVGYVANISAGTFGSSAFSYYVELSNSALSKVVARSATESFSGTSTPSYASNAEITVALPTLALVMPFHAGGYRAVPEPTSGLMLLLGAAMLGLKRKNRSVA